MGRTRSKKFYLENEALELGFGTYTMLMYYALTLNSVKGKKLFDATMTEWAYRVNYDLDLTGITSSDIGAHFVISDIQDAISFIDGDLINALESEKEDLLTKYGGKSNFEENVNSNEGIIGFVGVADEYYIDDPESLIGIAEMLKDFLQVAVNLNKSYNVIP